MGVSVTDYVELPLVPAPGTDLAPKRRRLRRVGEQVGHRRQAWVGRYRRRAVQIDLAAGAVAAGLGITVRFGHEPRFMYVVLGVMTPFLWLGVVFLTRGYERRFLGTGTDEYRSLTQAAMGLLAVTALISYAWQLYVARGFVLPVCPAVLALDLLGRWLLRRWLNRQRALGRCMQRTIVIAGRTPPPA